MRRACWTKLSFRCAWFEKIKNSSKEPEENRATGQSGQAFPLQTRTILEIWLIVPSSHTQAIAIDHLEKGHQ
jgi:hypothetical protein